MCWFVGNAGGESAKGEEKMAHIKNRLRGLLAAFVALVAALAIVPGVANAQEDAVNWTSDQVTQNITVNGLKGEGTVEFFQLGKVTLNPTTNETSFEVTITTDDEGASIKTYVGTENPTPSDAAAILEHVTLPETAMDTQTFSSGQTSVVSDELAAGLYYVRITDSTGEFTYQTMIVGLSPEKADGGASWTLKDPNPTVKVSSSDIQKTRPADEPVNLGDTTDFTVTVTLNQYMNSFNVYDQMTGLEYVADSMMMYLGSEATGDTAATGDTPESDFYDVSWNAESHLMTVTFNKAYLETLEADQLVTIKYTALVCSHATIEGGLSNKAYTDNNRDGSMVTIDLGKAGVYKYDSETEEPLAGAIFQVFEADGTALKTTAGEDVYVMTGADGFAWTDEDTCNANGEDLTGKVILEEGFQVYFVETKAPAGYRLPSSESNKFDCTAIGIDGEEIESSAKPIENTPAGGEHGVDLPETGGMGTVALTAAGVVLVAGAAAFIVRSRKEN